MNTKTPGLKHQVGRIAFTTGEVCSVRGFLFPFRTSCELSLCSPHLGTLASISQPGCRTLFPVSLLMLGEAYLGISREASPQGDLG